MIQFVYGEDTYRARQKVKQLLKGIQRYHILDEIQSSNYNWNLLTEQQHSLFGDSNAYLIVNLLGNDQADKLLDQLKKINKQKSDTLYVIWEQGSPDKRRKLVKWLIKSVTKHQFDPLKPYQVQKWLKQELNNHPYEPKVPKILTDYHGNNLWLLKNEVEKLKSYKPKDKITVKDVMSLSAKSLEEDIFDAMDALSVKNIRLATKLLKNLIREKDINYVFSMIIRQFRLLILSKAPKGLDTQHPYVKKKIQEQSGRWDKKQLLRIYQKLLEIDLSHKFGQTDLETSIW